MVLVLVLALVVVVEVVVVVAVVAAVVVVVALVVVLGFFRSLATTYISLNHCTCASSLSIFC